VDFPGLKELLNERHIRVFELSPALTVDQVKSGVAYVLNTWGPA
jgi:hypothetical protein